MSIDVWLAYATAFLVLSLIPGSSVFMALAQSLSRGFKAACYCIAGDMLGGIVVMTVAYAGLGTILAASSEIYTLIKWAGVAYLVWMGISQIVNARRLNDADIKISTTAVHLSGGFRAGFLTGVLNPKAILFYVAFLAQFIDSSLPMAPQFLILLATSSLIVLLVLGAYAWLAAVARKALNSLRARKRMGYVGGALLLGGSALMATR
ncbi:MAG: LysE family translocator [Rhizobiaceae bacterium]